MWPRPYERNLCSNVANGNRFETYAIPGDSGSGQIVLNGAAAFQGKKGDLLTIMSFAQVYENWLLRGSLASLCSAKTIEL